MVYDNLLSFTLIAIFDLVAILVAEQLIRHTQLEGALGRVAGGSAGA
jgi:hypothetical protein